MNWMLKQRGVLYGLCLIFAWAGFAAAKEPVRAEAPALWKVRGGQGGTVYLMGSIHIFPAGVEWRSPAIDRALREARTIVFETDMTQAQDPAVMDPLIRRHALLANGETLQSVIPATSYAELQRVGAELALPVESLSNMRPWFVAMLITLQTVARMGFDPNNGIDLQVHRWAVANKKKTGALESLETQMKILSGLSREQENEFLLMTLSETRGLQTELNEMLSAYRKGDTAQLDKIINSSMDPYPELRARVLKERNDNWLPQVERMLKEGGTHVVVVGAAHLVGRDSLVALLRAKGFKVEGP